MALELINEGGNAYVSDKRLYLTRAGAVVEEGDPAADSLLVGEGGTISHEDAERYGLLEAPAAEPPAKEARAAKPAPKLTAKAPAKPAAQKK